MANRYDRNLIVIGAGSAGLVSAYIAATVNASVTLVEKQHMGGDCLNTGCVPSKALIKSARIASLIRRADEFGIRVGEPKVDFQAVMNRVQTVIKTIEPHDSVERYQSLGVDCLSGEAIITDPHTVQVGDQTLTARNIIVASGAEPFIPPIKGIEQINYLTSENLWQLNEQPRRLIVLGGGPIGCELSQAFARLGTQVTQVEMAERILPREDPDVSALMLQRFSAEGIKLMLDTRAEEVRVADGQQQLLCSSSGEQIALEFDAVLVAVGRKARITGFGLEELGVSMTPQRTIQVNDYLQTSVPSIYACGDVAGPYQFTHTAAHQAWYAAVNSLFGRFKRFRVDYRVIPWCTFTEPEVARVGINEQEAKQQGIDYELSLYGLDDLDRAITEGETTGFIKVLTKPGKDTIIGATIVGETAGELITEYIQAMKQGFGMNKILGTIHIYPTLAEANKYAAGIWKKNHAPQWALSLLKQFHRWQLKS